MSTVSATRLHTAPRTLLEQLAQEQLDQEQRDREQLAREAAEEEPAAAYPCPDILWQGVFLEVADIVRQRSWEVWLGTLTALAALAHRQIEVRYYGRVCGNIYGLLIKPTGTGKKLCTDVCEQLLPTWYRQVGTVSSGPGLGPVLADIEREKGGKILAVTPHPTIMVLHEWTSLAKYLKIQFSTLSEDLNKIFDCPDYHSISRSDRERTGGHVSIPTPTLSILGTTTDQLFRAHITDEMIFSGFLNRYLILPGSYVPWRAYEEEQAEVDLTVLSQQIQFPAAPPPILGYRNALKDCYTPDAWEAMYHWQVSFFEDGIMSQANETPMAERLHVYAHKIALLYAWAGKFDQIEEGHVAAARAVIETSARYLQELGQRGDVTVPPQQRYAIDLTEKILSLIQRRPGQLSVRLIHKNHLRKSATYTEVKRTVGSLVEGEVLFQNDRGWLFPA
jgi:hypothetical protein